MTLRRKTVSESALSHDALAHTLAQHLAKGNRRVWEDVPAGPSGAIRPDVYTIEKSFSNPNPITYEVKVSRSDFLADIKKGKWQRYLDFSYGVVFAAPKGLIAKKEIPEKCGFIQFNGQSWTTSKRPTIEPRPLDTKLMLKLIIEGDARESTYSPAVPSRELDVHRVNAELRKKYGEEIGESIAMVKTLSEDMAELTALKAELGALLDVPVDKWCFAEDAAYKISCLRKELAEGHAALRARGEKELLALKEGLNKQIEQAIRRL